MRLILMVPLVVVALLCVATPAAAQPQRGGERALFGGGVANADQVLSISSKIAGTYFETLGPRATDVFDRLLPNSAWLGQGSAQMSYTASLPHLSAAASFGGFSVRYTRPRREWVSQYLYNASLGSSNSWSLTPRTQLGVNLAANLRPSYWALAASQGQLGSATGDLNALLILPPDVRDVEGRSVQTAAGLFLSRDVSRRVTGRLDYQFDRRDEFGRTEPSLLDDQFTHTGRASLTAAVTRHFSVRGGYRYSDTRYAQRSRVRQQGADFGVDYNRGGTFQLTRKTTLAVNGGIGAATDTNRRQRYFLLGRARLNREIGRTWSAALLYDRSLDFPSLLQEPTLLDTVTAQFGGLLSSRLTFRSAAAYSQGAVGFSGNENRYIRSNGSASLEAAISRYFSLGAAYAYYRRDIGTAVVLPTDISRRSESQVVNVYVSTWAPILTHARRRTNASR